MEPGGLPSLGVAESDSTEQLALHTSLHCIFRLKPPHLLVHLFCTCSINIQFNSSTSLSSYECILVCHWSLSLLKCTDHVAIMHCSPGLSCIDHVTDHVLIMFGVTH